jgi:hypothetical protein
MGLDATGYKNTKLIEIADVDTFEEKYSDGNFAWALINPEFGGWEDQVKDKGVYSYDDAESVSIGYGTHRWFRDMLARIGCATTAEAIWENPDKYESSPFYRLIDFSDCEGIIGAKHCAKLAKDFADFQHATDGVQDERFKRYYKEWRIVFETAAQNGFVDFH